MKTFTGWLKALNSVSMLAIMVAIVACFHNLNSGKERIKGRYSSLSYIGRTGLSYSSSSTSLFRGVKNLIKRFKKKIAKP